MKNKALAVLLLSTAVCMAGCSGGSEGTVATTVATKEADTAEEKTTVEEKTSADDEKASSDEVTDAPETTEEDSTEESTSVSEPEEKITESETTTTDLSGIFESEVGNPTFNIAPITFVVKGVKYTSPSDYMVMYSDDIGPIVYINNVFQMKMIRKDATFDEVLDGMDELDDKSIANGAKSVVEPTTKRISGKEYVYFVVDMDGEEVMGILTESPDGKFSMGGQIVIQSDKVSYDDLLNMFATIAETASVTDEPDSNDEDITSQIKYVTGEKRISSKLTYKEATVTFKVPEGFYYTSETTGATSGSQFFSSADYDAYISIEDKAFPDDTDEYAIDAMIKYEENAVKQVEKVNGRNVYICVSHYTSDISGKVFYSITCRQDIDDYYSYVVSADCVDKGDISFDVVKKFFEFED